MPFSNSTSLGPMFSSWSFNMVVTSCCCMPSQIHDMLEYASIESSSMAYSTCPPTFGWSRIIGPSFNKGLCCAPLVIWSTITNAHSIVLPCPHLHWGQELPSNGLLGGHLLDKSLPPIPCQMNHMDPPTINMQIKLIKPFQLVKYNVYMNAIDGHASLIMNHKIITWFGWGTSCILYLCLTSVVRVLSKIQQMFLNYGVFQRPNTWAYLTRAFIPL